MEIAGPVRGSRTCVTKYSPDGTRTRGTLNNCAHGVTPWNTYLTAEENWAGYFRNGDQQDQKPNLPREHARYGVRPSLGATAGTRRGGRRRVRALRRLDEGRNDATRTTATSRTPSAGWSRSIPFDPEQRAGQAHRARPLRA
jgi:uncharacterized protein